MLDVRTDDLYAILNVIIIVNIFTNHRLLICYSVFVGHLAMFKQHVSLGFAKST